MAQIKVVLALLLVTAIAQASVLQRQQSSHDVDALEIIKDVPEKINYLEKILKDLNIDVDTIREHIEESVQKHRIGKRSVQNRNDTSSPGSDIVNGILDGIYGAINTALKTGVDAMLVSLNATTGGILSQNLVDFQAFLYAIIDAQFPTTTTTYVSKVII